MTWTGWEELLREVEPSHIFHLAALTSPQAGWDALHDVNVRGTGQLLEAVRLSGFDPAIVVAGSSAAYGAVEPGERPIGEDQPFRPRNVYAVSKVAQEMLAYSYHARYGLRVVRARPFNLTGPGESPAFVTSAFAQQIARIEAGLQQPAIEVGNLHAVRDFTDVRDAVRAYRLLGEQGRPGEVYNICSGRGIEIRWLLDTLLSLTNPGIAVNHAASRWQQADVPSQVGDAGRLVQASGWQPEIPLHADSAGRARFVEAADAAQECAMNWNGRSVLVTGAGGFIGSHLTERLVREGARVRAFVRYNSRQDVGLLSLLPRDVLASLEVVSGDLRDGEAIRKALTGVEVAFHLGALIAIPYSYVHPREVVETNVLGTLNVLMAARDLGTDRVVAHLDQRSVWHRALCPDRRSPPAAGAVALLGEQDRRRQDRRELLPVLRPPCGDDPPLQYVRAAAIGTGRHSHDHHPGVGRQRGAAGGARPGA